MLKHILNTPLFLAVLVITIAMGTQTPHAAFANESTQSPIPLTSDFWRRLFPRDEEQDPPTISRGDFCLITPARLGQDIAIWHQQPVFVWTGDIGKLTLTEADQTTELWSYTPEDTENTAGNDDLHKVVYDGPLLQPSHRYTLNIYKDITSTAPIFTPSFTTLSFIQHWLVGNGLIANATDDLGRAYYFANRELPVDGIQALFSVESADPELLDFQQQLVQEICNQSDDTTDEATDEATDDSQNEE